MTVLDVSTSEFEGQDRLRLRAHEAFTNRQRLLHRGILSGDTENLNERYLAIRQEEEDLLLEILTNENKLRPLPRSYSRKRKARFTCTRTQRRWVNVLIFVASAFILLSLVAS